MAPRAFPRAHLDPAETAVPAVRTDLAPPRTRDLQVDFFRGLSLLMVFLIHTQSHLLLWFTTCNVGFSDPAEVFVCLSGYTAGLVYGAVLRRAGWPAAARRILRQAGRIYGGHLLLSAAVLTLTALAGRFASAGRLAQEMHLSTVLQAPGTALLSALRLQFRPANLDILPLFVLLFLTFPAILFLLDRWPIGTLAASGGLYVVAHVWRINLAGTPGTVWFFNPFAWQSLFCLGACCGLGRRRLAELPGARGPLPLAAGLVLAWSAVVTLRWHFPALPDVVPAWLAPHLYPISKTDLDPARLVHFCALAYLVAVRWPVPSWVLESRGARAVIRCGQHSLAVFGWGVLLSSAAEIGLAAVRPGALLVPLALGVGGILAQCGLAAWLARLGGTPSGRPREGRYGYSRDQAEREVDAQMQTWGDTGRKVA